jgi:hypothetical protein
MSAEMETLRSLLHGSLVAANFALPLTCRTRLCDLRQRFLAKGRVGHGHRAIARNGRVLLAANRPLEELDGARALVRLQTWHKSILSDDPPLSYGILVCIRVLDGESGEAEYETRLVSSADPLSALALDVGGRRWLEFRCAGA